MNRSDLYFHSNQTKPYFYFQGIPVYLTTLLLVAHVVALLVSVLVPVWPAYAAFSSPLVADMQIWRLGTYVFVHGVGISFVINMVFLFLMGRQLEEVFGRRSFGLLYLLATLIPVVVGMLGWWIFQTPVALAGTNIVHFNVMLGLAFFQPNAAMFVEWLKLKWIAMVVFAVYCLQYLQARDFVSLSAFVAASAGTYFWLRNCGLSPRFAGLAELFAERFPKRPPLRALPSAQRGEKADGKFYEPKIRPKPEIDREHPAVVEIDALLEKISKEGFASLTAEEKQALDRASAELKEKDKRL